MALGPCVACPAMLTHLLDVSGVPLALSLRRRRPGLWEGPGQSEGPAWVGLLGRSELRRASGWPSLGLVLRPLGQGVGHLDGQFLQEDAQVRAVVPLEKIRVSLA